MRSAMLLQSKLSDQKEMRTRAVPTATTLPFTSVCAQVVAKNSFSPKALIAPGRRVIACRIGSNGKILSAGF